MKDSTDQFPCEGIGRASVPELDNMLGHAIPVLGGRIAGRKS